MLIKKIPSVSGSYRVTMSQFQLPAHNGAESGRGEAREDIEDVLAELNSLIGLEKVKRLVSEIHAYIKVQKERKRMGLASEPLVLHMIFKGNPGTGKTTVARLLGRAFVSIGLLSRGHIVEVERADLVGEYIGQTAQKTRKMIDEALGGILFIDEAYSLARGGERDFGKEAIDTIVKAMEDNKEDLILILAGYRNEMDYFLKTNPGLKSRFPIHMEFSDYSIEELMRISDSMVKERQYILTPGARAKVRDILHSAFASRELAMGNARFVRNLIERAVRKQALRLAKGDKISKEQLMTIEMQDIIDADGED